MGLIDNFLAKKGLERIEKKTVIQYAIDNLVALSVTKGKGKFAISFPLFKDETVGSYSTPKENKQRIAFLQSVKDEVCVDFSKSAPVAKFEDEKIAVDFLKRHSIVELCIEYSNFAEVNSDFTISVEECEGNVLKYRSNIPTETEIMRDVFRNNEYVRKGLRLDANDVVLDIGGNIGAFSCRNFRSVKEIIAFEPEAVNHAIFAANVEDNNATNVKLINKAVVGNDDKTRDFFLGKVPYYYSFLVKNNRKRVTVECININDIMKQYKPTKMKVDIEGAEWEVLTSCKDFGRVEQLIFEYNFDMNGDLKNSFEHFEILTKHLEANGFDVSALKKYSRSKSWAEVFLCERVKK